jgi:hypothetical protein
MKNVKKALKWAIIVILGREDFIKVTTFVVNKVKPLPKLTIAKIKGLLSKFK